MPPPCACVCFAEKTETTYRSADKGFPQAEGLVEDNTSTSRPWTVGVHVRRGDVKNKKRIVPHLFFVEAVRSVLYGIAEVRYAWRVGRKGRMCFLSFAKRKLWTLNEIKF